MTPSKNNSKNASSVTGLVAGSGRIAMTFMCVVLPCLCVGMATAEDTPVRIGNPLLARFPTSGDPYNVMRRSTWDMHYFNNKIYIGSGDFAANSGPTDVWTYNGSTFVKEYTVDDESIWDFFEFENKLFIPGNDATEDWSFENLYINDPNRVPNPGWIKLRTMPGGLHCFNVALFKGKLYASITTDGSTPNRTLVSTDMGETWTTFISEYSSFVVFDDFMFVVGDNYYRYDGTTLETVTPNLFESMNNRKARFHDGVLYANPTRNNFEWTRLYFLPVSQIKDGGVATNIVKFAHDGVRDIVVRGTTCYVMTAQEITQDVAYKGRIYSSTNLTYWRLTTEFIVPGIPLSFEIMNNKFYIGLGSRPGSYDPSLGWGYIGPESGSIWEIVAPPMDMDNDDDELTDEQETCDLDPLTPGVQNPFDPDNPDSTGDNGDPNPDGVPDGQNDWDGDGMTNAEEFQWGCNPIDPNSFAVLPTANRMNLGITVGLMVLAAAMRTRKRNSLRSPPQWRCALGGDAQFTSRPTGKTSDSFAPHA